MFGTEAERVDRNGYILVQRDNEFQPTQVSGDITIDEDGITSIGADKIINSNIKMQPI